MNPSKVLLLLVFTASAAHAEPLRVQGSSVVARVLSAAAPIMKQEHGIELKIAPEGGSTGGILSVGAGAADLGMTVRPLTGEDRSGFPERRLVPVLIGHEALAVIVPADVWGGGVRKITKAQMLSIYEGDLKNWKALGGPNQPIKFFNPAREGAWEYFVTWLYGDIRKAPLGKDFETVSSSRDARNSVQFTTGSISVAPPMWADGKTVFALAIESASGAAISPTLENMQSQQYPITRPLYVIAGDRPTGAVKKVLEFLVSARGQELVKKVELIPAQNPKMPD